MALRKHERNKLRVSGNRNRKFIIRSNGNYLKHILLTHVPRGQNFLCGTTNQLYSFKFPHVVLKNMKDGLQIDIVDVESFVRCVNITLP